MFALGLNHNHKTIFHSSSNLVVPWQDICVLTWLGKERQKLRLEKHSFSVLKQNQKILTYAKLTKGSFHKEKIFHCLKPSNVFLTQVSNYKSTALPEHKTNKHKHTCKVLLIHCSFIIFACTNKSQYVTNKKKRKIKLNSHSFHKIDISNRINRL